MVLVSHERIFHERLVFVSPDFPPKSARIRNRIIPNKAILKPIILSRFFFLGVFASTLLSTTIAGKLPEFEANLTQLEIGDTILKINGENVFARGLNYSFSIHNDENFDKAYINYSSPVGNSSASIKYSSDRRVDGYIIAKGNFYVISTIGKDIRIVFYDNKKRLNDRGVWSKITLYYYAKRRLHEKISFSVK